MFCQHCGAQLGDGAKFCTKCGKPVGQQVNSGNPIQQQGMMPNMPVQQEKRGHGVVIGLGIIIMLVALLAGGTFFYLSHGLKNEEETASLHEEQESDKEDARNEEEQRDVDDSSVEEMSEETSDVIYTEYRALEGIEEELSGKINTMNGDSYEVPTIDVYEENYSPGVRNYDASWDSRVFYQVEGLVDQSEYFCKDFCTLVKKQLWTKKDNHQLDYEIYLNPNTGRPNKIISLEYLSAGLEVTEYYYDNNGKISFIFQYNTDNYVSCYATPNMQGSRYLFNNDCLVTWRVVKSNYTDNYAIGNVEVNRLSSNYPASSIRSYASLSADMQRTFDDAEKKMINAAYNTYNQVMDAEGVAMIRGYVRNAEEAGLEDAEIMLFTEDFEAPMFTMKTDSDGEYVLFVPNDSYAYNLRVCKDGFSEGDIYRVEIGNEQTEFSQDTVYLFEEDAGNASVELMLGDALNYSSDGNSMEPIRYADIYVRNGLNNRIGDIISQIQSDNQGYADISLLSGNYTLQITAAGFEDMYFNIVANAYKMQNFYELYTTPTLEEGEFRIVLTWGATPYDLDSHLFTSTNDGSGHIWYGHRYDNYGSDLDVDDTDSYGPETVTIRDYNNTSYYKYCVADFTNCCEGDYGSYEMSNSNACVNVYSNDGLIASFHVPTSRPGVIWEVFEIRNGKISPIQRYYNTVLDKDWWSHE